MVDYGANMYRLLNVTVDSANINNDFVPLTKPSQRLGTQSTVAYPVLLLCFGSRVVWVLWTLICLTEYINLYCCFVFPTTKYCIRKQEKRRVKPKESDVLRRRGEGRQADGAA